jgi:hypothetical protein
MMHTHAIAVEGTPYGTSFTDSSLLGAVADTSAPNQLTCRQSARNIVRVDYDETKYTEVEFSERNKSPKAAAVQTGPVVALVPDVATCIPRLGRGLPSRAVNSAQAMHEASPVDVFLRGGAQANTTSINTTNRQAALATYADTIAETFSRAASSSSTQSDFSTPSVPNSPTASAATVATASTTATTATAATVPINAADAEAAAASTSGLSKLYKYREKVNQTVVASWSAIPADSAMPAPSAPPAMGDLLSTINQANQEVPSDKGMSDAAGASKIEEISTRKVLPDTLNKVCRFEILMVLSEDHL